MTQKTIVFESTLTGGNRAVKQACDFLKDHRAYHVYIELTLAEAINNVVQHAYTQPSQAKLILLIDGHDVCCSVIDHGCPYIPPLKTPDPNIDNGFGWYLIRAFSSAVSLSRDTDTNHLKLAFTSAA